MVTVNCNIFFSDNCIRCKRFVRPRQEALQCDNCDGWQHRTCDTGTDTFFYTSNYILHDISLNNMTYFNILYNCIFPGISREQYRRWVKENTDFEWTCQNCNPAAATFHISLASVDDNNNSVVNITST